MGSYEKLPPHLPQAKGPYVPGCMDVMLDYTISGTFMRLYYPTNVKKEKIDYTKWVPWLSDDNYLIGMAKAIMVIPLAIKLVMWWYSGNYVLIPSLYGERINTESKLKIVLISHGYASNRFLYSTVCNELASRGYLVAVIEHRDQSACYTYFYKSKEDARLDVRATIDVQKIKLGQGHYESRNQQVNQRADECEKLLDFFINLNNGKVPHNVMDDIKTDREINFKLEDLVGKLDLSSITMAGHSFGGATTLLTLSRRKEIKQGILLDPWMFPIKGEENLAENVTQPLLFINTQTFHISPNIQGMEKYMTNEHRLMYTLLHTTHESQTDTVCIMGYWLNWFMKKLNPTLALRINNALMLRFLKECTGHAESIEDCEKILIEQNLNVTNGITKPWA